MSNARRVLLLDSGAVGLLVTSLLKRKFNCKIESFWSLDSFLQIGSKVLPELIVMNAELLKENQAEILLEYSKAQFNIPFVFYTSHSYPSSVRIGNVHYPVVPFGNLEILVSMIETTTNWSKPLDLEN